MNDILDRLNQSKFRSRFYLNKKMIDYISNKGFNTITDHAYEFINNRLKPAYPTNDGKQTPMKGHPVFIAQHACACCCRSCLEKWHHIEKERELTQEEVDYIVKILIRWIKREYDKRIV